MHPDPITEIIRQRRSVKPAMMRPDPVPRDTVELLLENASWAPTHGLTEPWHFVVFSGDSRQALATALQTAYRQTTEASQFRPEKHDKLGTSPLQAPTVIAIVMNRQTACKIPEWEDIAAVACAIQNLHLTATALGLGGYWSSSPLVATAPMNQFLELEPPLRCLGLFYLGWPKEGLTLQSQRTPVAEKTRWI